MNSAKRNYFIDLIMGIAFLIVFITALVFLVPKGWIDFSSSTTPTVLGINFGIWQDLHIYAGIAMMIGAVIHQVLHWKWFVNMTKKVFTPKAKESDALEPPQTQES